MPSTYSTRNRLEKQAAGENNNSWGTLLNTNMIDMVDQAVDGMASYTLSGSKTLTSNNGSSDEARCRYQNITSGTGGTVTIPNVEKSYIVRNNCTGAVEFTTGSGTSCSVAAKNVAIVVCEGGNVCRAFPILGTFTINFPFDGGGADIEVGAYGEARIDFPFTILSAGGMGDDGGLLAEITKDSFANYPPTGADKISASAPAGYFGGTDNEDTTLTGWTTGISAGDVIRATITASSVEKGTIFLKCVRTG